MEPGREPIFEEEFDRLFARAFAVSRRLLGDPATAEDIAAEALARTYSRWGRVRTFEYRDAWIARVATNLSIDHVRKRRVQAQAAIEQDPSDSAVLPLALLDALGRLPRRQREAIALRYLADSSIEDVADSLGVTTGTVKQTSRQLVRRPRGLRWPALLGRHELDRSRPNRHAVIATTRALRRKYSRPRRWYFRPKLATLAVVIRARGAASISMGRTPHETHDEMCRARTR